MPIRRVTALLLLLWRGVCRLLLLVVPVRPHAVVHGWPDDEGNAVEVVRGLRRRYRGTVYWLLRDPSYGGPAHAVGELAPDARLVRVRKDSPRAVLLSLTAETTFFTHGLSTAVVPPADRLVVNVWHGDGPKLARDTRLVRSTVAVAGTRLWGGQRSRRFRLPSGNVAVVGNPRIDQFGAAGAADVLERLGLDAGRRTVLWLPTYRAAAGPRGRAWADGDNLSQSDGARDVVLALAQAAREHAVQIVVKPHPLDADAYDDFGLQVLRHRELGEAGVSLYQLLGASDAIISDVSSVWVDYLVLDRPVGFYVPDLEDLQRRRGFNVPDLERLLPGERLRSAQDARRFVATVARDPAGLRPSQYPGYDAIGPVTALGATDRLLDWLDAFQRARGRTALFDGRPSLRRP